MTLAVIDWIFIVVLLIFIIAATIKGFINEIFGKASWISGIILAIFLYSKVGLILHQKIESLALCNVLAFVLIFAGVFLIVKIVGGILHKIFELRILRGLDKVLGAMFGLVEGFAIICLIMFIMTIQPFFDATGLLKDSFFYDLMNTFIPEVKAAITNV